VNKKVRDLSRMGTILASVFRMVGHAGFEPAEFSPILLAHPRS
jgi:hypothetical protein